MIFHVLEALSVTFFGLLGIWAALARHHWFLRLTVVGLAIGSLLLISAYEVVVMFAIQVLTILVVVWLARRPTRIRPQFSLETALLLIVLVSVVTALAIRLPEWAWYDWLRIVAIGLFSAFAALLALWIICGKPRIRIRACLGALGLAVLVLLRFSMYCFDYALNNGRVGVRWELFFKEFVSWEIWRHPWLLESLLQIAIGLAAMLTMIVLGRSSQWFTDESNKANPADLSNRLLVRWLLCVSAAAIALPLAFVLWKLATPQALPVVHFPHPNGYDDLIAAGTAAQALKLNTGPAFSLSDTQLGAQIQSLQSVLDRIDLGLSRESLVDLRVIAERGETRTRHQSALAAVDDALWRRYAYIDRVGTPRQKLEKLLGILRFTQQAYRGTGLSWHYLSPPRQSADFALGELKGLLKQFDESDCRDAVRFLGELDESRESWSEKSRVQRLLDEHGKWTTRLQAHVMGWSGQDASDWMRDRDMRHLDLHRSVTIAYAIKVYYLTNHRLPADLNALVPEFLPRIPDDPYCDGTMKMKLVADGIVVYSAGLDGDDDGGTPSPMYPNGTYDPSQGDDVWVIPEADLVVQAQPK